MSFTQHIDECHQQDLAESVEAYRALKPVHRKDAGVLALSMYNEGIAIAIRRGAPLASYSIDRKCLREYNTHLTHEDTGTSVCFTCARKFPRVHGTKNNPIKYYPLIAPSSDRALPKKVEGPDGHDMSMSFLGCLNGQATESLFGLNTYCDKYGKMNDVVTLPPTHQEFDDWLCIP